MDEIVYTATIIISMFMGVGFLVIVVFAMSLFTRYFSREIKSFERECDVDDKYNILEGLVLEELAKKCGYDLKKEIEEQEVSGNKKFRKRLQKKMFTDMLANKDKTKK